MKTQSARKSYSYTLSLTSALERGGWQRHAPGKTSTRNTGERVSLGTELDGHENGTIGL